MGRGDHPHQRGRLPAREPKPGRRARHPHSPRPEDRGPARRPRRDQGRAPCRVRDPRRAARQDDPAEGAEGTPGPRRAADRSRGRGGDAGRPAADARPPQPGRRRADRRPVAGAVGRRAAFPHGRRGRTKRTETRRCGGTRTRAGSRSGFPPRSCTSPTARTAVTGCPARSPSPIAATSRRAGRVGRGAVRHLLRPGQGQVAPRRVMEGPRAPGPVPARPDGGSRRGGRPERGASRHRRARPDGNITGTPFTIRWNLPGCPRPPATGASAPPSLPCIATARETRRAGRRRRRPQLRRSPLRGTREDREQAVERQARPEVPAPRRGHPHRPVQGPPRADDRER